MKTTFVCLAIILTIIIFSCSDNSVTPTTAAYSLNGKIDNWTYGNMKLVAEVYDSEYVHSAAVDSCIIATDGSFALNLKTPPASMLSTLSHTVLAGCTGSIFVNPSDTKHTQLQISVYDSSRRTFGTVFKMNYDSTLINGSFYCDYYYCDKSVSVVGTEQCTPGSGDTTIYLYDWSGSSSWNKVVSLYNINGHASRFSFTNTEPSGGSWRFHKSPFEAKKERIIE